MENRGIMNKVRLKIDGKDIEVAEGATVAAAVYQTGCSIFHRSVSGQPRGPLCGMGICFDCRVTLNGTPHVRSCMSLCREGMEVVTK